MRTPRRVVVLLHSDARFVELVRRASAGHFDLEIVGSWEQAKAKLRRLGSRSLLLVDVGHGSGKGTLSPDLRRLLAAFPSATVVGVIEAGSDLAELACTLGRWGLSQVIDRDLDRAPEILRARLERARGRALRSLLARGVGLRTSQRGRSILDAAVQIAAAGCHPRELAHDLRVTGPTLLRWCHEARLPSPRRLLLWVRLLTAAEMLDDPGQRVSEIAHACGYSSDAAMRRSFRLAVGDPPRSLRQKGAFRAASQAFTLELQAIRRPAPRRAQG
jgi:AraC-like DNA-binding protein